MKIGLLMEGGIDEEIISPLITQVLLDVKLNRRQETVYHRVPFPPNGYGEILKNLKLLIELYNNPAERSRIGCDLFVVLLDARKTSEVQRQIKDMLRTAVGFPAVYGVAIQETEAWVLGDIENVNRNVFKVHPDPQLPRAPEKDPDPKKTLVDLFIRSSPVLEYDAWNIECARLVALHLRKDVVAARCPKGFGKFMAKLKRTVEKINTKTMENLCHC